MLKIRYLGYRMGESAAIGYSNAMDEQEVVIRQAASVEAVSLYKALLTWIYEADDSRRHVRLWEDGTGARNKSGLM